MNLISQLLHDNLDVIFFLYGLIFVLMGVAIFVQYKSNIQQKYTKIIWFLTIFGISHGITEWINMWRIIKGNYLILNIIQWFLILISFICFFEFSKNIFIEGLTRYKKIQLNKYFVKYISSFVIFLSIIIGIISGDVFKVSRIYSKYFFCFASGILIIISLYFFYNLEKNKLREYKLKKYFILAGISFFCYGILAGCITNTDFNHKNCSCIFGIPVVVFKFFFSFLATLSIFNLVKIFSIKGIESLNQSLNLLKKITEGIDQEILLINTEFKVIWSNKEEINESGLGSYCYKIIHNENKPCRSEENICPIREHLKNNLPSKVIHTRIKNSEQRFIEIEVYPLTDGSGKNTRFVHLSKDITEQKKAEQLLVESEEKYRTIVENSHDMIAIMDSRRNFIFFNKDIEKLTGYKNQELLKTNLKPMIGNKDSSKFENIFKETLTGKYRDYESVFKKKDGTDFILSVHSVPYYKSGKIIGVINFARDITDEKKAKKLLIESEEKYRTIIENSNDMIWMLNIEGDFIYFNKAAEEISGYRLEDFFGKSFEPMIIPEELTKIKKVFLETISGKSVHYSTRIYKKDKNILYLSVNTAPIYKSGEIYGTVSFGRDVTKEKQAEEELLKFKLGIEKSNEAIFLTKIDGTIIYTNPSFEKIYGYTQTEIIGKTPRILKSGIHSDAQYKNFWDKLLAKKIIVGEIINKTKDNRLINVQSSANPILDNNGDIIGFLAIQSDITERKYMEDSIIKSLKEKEILLKEIHHRVKNNMQIISSLLRMQARKIDDTKIKNILQINQDRIITMSLIHEKLYKAAQFNEIDFSEYIKDIIENIKCSYNLEATRITFKMDIESVKVGMDLAVSLGLIINELLSNVFKYAFPENQSGIIEIKIKSKEINMLQIIINDNGIGIRKIDEIYKANTLGLSLVKTLVEEQLKGKLLVTIENGTKFEIIIDKNIT